MMIDHLVSRAGSNRKDPSRRAFLQAGAAAGGGLMLSLSLPFADGASAANVFAPNAYISIAADGQVTLTMPYVEMGQGTYTSIPMLIAEELEIGLEQVRLSMLRPTRSSTPILCWGCRPPVTQTRYAGRGSRCAGLGRPREPCWRRRPPVGMLTRRRAARNTARFCIRRREDALRTESLPTMRSACQFPTK